MAITATSHGPQGFGPKTVETHFAGRVIEIRTGVEERNCSGDLDISDRRKVPVKYALVWLGETGKDSSLFARNGEINLSSLMYCKERELEFHEQFVWIDCSNIRTYAGQPAIEVEVDAQISDVKTEMVMWVNWLAWKSHTEAKQAEQREVEAAAAKAQADHELACQIAKERHLKLRPKKGDKVIVIKGRKAKKGTKWIAAAIYNERVLLKEEATWQDRNVNGVWVAIDNVEKDVG